MELSKSIPAPKQADAEFQRLDAGKGCQSLNLTALLLEELHRVTYLGLQFVLVRIGYPESQS
jgi:hypothetical protein